MPFWRINPTVNHWDLDMRQLQLLQEMPIFGGVLEQTLEFILNHAGVIEVDKGHYFFQEDDLANSMYVLETGEVEVVRAWQGKEYSLNHLNPGDCFGEMALMGFRPRSASVRALQDSQAIEITTGLFLELYDAYPQQFTLIQMNMGREVCRRLYEADTRLFIEDIKRGSG
ncbi:MAG: cyclic nucleotide-binding domain-containing protein [Pseudomonadota bacterium]